jgi:hypothetical protein
MFRVIELRLHLYKRGCRVSHGLSSRASDVCEREAEHYCKYSHYFAVKLYWVLTSDNRQGAWASRRKAWLSILCCSRFPRSEWKLTKSQRSSIHLRTNPHRAFNQYRPATKLSGSCRCSSRQSRLAVCSEKDRGLLQPKALRISARDGTHDQFPKKRLLGSRYTEKRSNRRLLVPPYSKWARTLLENDSENTQRPFPH